MTKTKSSAKILFININPRPKWTKEKTLIHFPMGLSFVMSEVSRNGYDFDLLDLKVSPKTDEEIKDILSEKGYDIIGLGTLTHSYNIVKPMVKMIKEVLPKSVVVVGNYIASTQPEFFLEHTEADIAVIGEGERTFIEIIERVISGKGFDGCRGIAHKSISGITREASREPIMDLDTREFPRWDLFDMESYIQSAKNYKIGRQSYDFLAAMRPFPINTSRGCPFRCTFCSNSLFHKENPVRCHSSGYIVKMMKKLIDDYGINYFWLWDELSFFTKKQTNEILDAIIEADLNINFSATFRVGNFKKGDEDIAEKLKKAGCLQANYSLESGNPEILKAMNKKIEVDWFYEQKRILDDAGLPSQTNIVLGYPQETEESIKQTFDVCYETDLMPSIGFLLPAPGSIIYNYAIEHGYIKDEEEYLLTIGERQFLKLNMTKIPDDKFIELVNYHARRVRDKLGLNISDKHIICSIEIED